MSDSLQRHGLYSPPGFSVYEISQARILEWVAISYSRGSSWPSDRICLSRISRTGGCILYHCATWEAPGRVLLHEKGNREVSCLFFMPRAWFWENVMFQLGAGIKRPWGNKSASQGEADWRPRQNRHQFSSVQSLSRVRLFVTPWTAARQASLSITNSQSPPKPMSIELVMPSNHPILCRPLLLPSIFPSIRVSSHQVAKVLEFQLQYQSFQWTPRTDLILDASYQSLDQLCIRLRNIFAVHASK